MLARLRLPGVILLLALSACAHRPEAPRQVSPARSAGYIPASQYPLREQRETWQHGDEALSLLILEPEAPGSFPLVIFLGGLGNPADTPVALLRQWAAAGYKVVSVTDARHGPAVLASVRAREGDFRLIANEAYAAPSLQRRVNSLAWLMQEVQRRPGADNKPGLQHILLAGFDLGAQTVQAALGEHYAGVSVPALPPEVRAALILSPHASFTGEAFSERYRDMHTPALLVSSSEDVDRFDYTLNPGLREMPFRHMPGGEKFWLALGYASHAVIGGGSAQALASADAPRNSQRGNTGERAGGPGNRMGGMGGGGMGGPGGGGPGAQAAGAATGKLTGPASQDDQAQSLRVVSLAFIDAMLRDDPLAREWLQRDANRWLGDTGRLLRR